MPEYTPTEAENRAIALAGFNLTKALIDALESRGVLTDPDVQGIYDQTLTALEYRAQDASTDLARRILQAAIMSRGKKGD